MQLKYALAWHFRYVNPDQMLAEMGSSMDVARWIAFLNVRDRVTEGGELTERKPPEQQQLEQRAAIGLQLRRAKRGTRGPTR